MFKNGYENVYCRNDNLKNAMNTHWLSIIVLSCYCANTWVSGYFMVTLRNFISASLGLFLLTQCNTKHDNNSATQILSPSTKTQTENPLTGEWKYSSSIWYSSELTLQDNGTFKFHDQGCYGQKFSQGQWTNNNGTILLTSFDTFKQKEWVQKMILWKC